MSSRGVVVPLTLLLLLFVPAGGLAQGKGHGVEVRAVSAELVDTEPGGIVSLSFRVTNKTDAEEEFTESLRMPPDWQAIIPEVTFTLQPSETRVCVVAVAVPARAPQGRYEIAYFARSRRDYAIRDADTIAVAVLPEGESPPLVEEKPRTAAADGQDQASHRPVNHSNTTMRVELKVRSDEEYPAPKQPAEAAPTRGRGEAVTDGSGQGKGYGVEVRAVSGALTETEPGGILSLSFRITNRTATQEEFIESLKLPPDWQAVIPEATFTLEAMEAELRVVAVAVPAGARQGRYEIAYSVRSRRDYGIRDADTAAVIVPAVDDLGLFVEEKPESVVAGDEYQAKLRLVNRGNATLLVALEVKSEDKYPAVLDHREVVLAPASAASVVVTVKTDPDESRHRRHIVQIKAYTDEPKDGKPRAGATIQVEVIPRVTGKPDLHHRLPGEIALRAIGDGDGTLFQAELAASGTLDEAGMRGVDFLLRGPDAYQAGAFGERDEWWLNYSTPSLDVNLGDQSFGLSRLTDYYRYGKGLEIRTHSPDGSGELGAYYLKSRWVRPQTRQSGVYLGGRLSDRMRLRLNVLHRNQAESLDAPGFEDDLWSVECAWKPVDQMRLHLEYARSSSDRASEADDDAYLVEWDGTIGSRTHYSLSRIHAGPDYYGYYRDTDYAQASVNFPLGDRLQARASYRHWKQNLDLRPDQGSAPQEDLWSMGFRYRHPLNWYLSLDYDDLRYRDLLQLPEHDSRERPVRIGVGRSSDKYNLRLEYRGGKRRDLGSGEAYRVQHYSLFASYRSTPRLSCTLYCQLGDDDRRGSRLLGGSNNIGASVTWRPTDCLLLSLYYLKYNFNSDVRTETDQAQVLVKYILPDGTTWTLQARHNSLALGGRSENAYALSYTIPFALPISKKKRTGFIKGSVFDAGDTSKPGIAEAILIANGAAAVTDENGRFVFPSLAPGTYSLQVDRKSIGLDRVTQLKAPIPVEVAGGSITELEIGVVDAAVLSGSVTVVAANGDGESNGGTADDGSEVYVVGDPESPANALQTRGLPNILVELANDDEILRRVTDNRGEFAFLGLRPGTWRLSVYEDGLPAYHRLAEPVLDLVLAPAQSEHVCVEVVPRLRRIKLIEDDGGKIEGTSQVPIVRPTKSREQAPTPAGSAE